MRSVLSDIFREAIVEGHISNNPVTPTRTTTPTVSRERLELEQYIAIRESASTMAPWVGLAMDLALLTGQRREDVAAMRFDDIDNSRLQVTQGKTGMMISFPLDLEIESMNLKLGTIIDRCHLASTTEFMISAGIRKNSTGGSLHLDSLTKNFAEARIKSGLTFQSKPPTFHEIRSLSGRLYEKEKGKHFAQQLMGHKSEKMTDKYLDTRGKEYVML
ncbi:Integrase [Erwinia rhapontici]